jgi:23S rRNA (cytidine1920-2'-O)/16S rRNA (cytidine1409-2'-O)-methyltransferase
LTAWIILRRVLVNGSLVCGAYEQVPENGEVRIKEYYKLKYVNKGGLKLEKALTDFNICVRGKIALDCGASTGGFTDCLLQNGAMAVYAVDVGYGQLAGKLLIDDRVVNMEKTNLSDERLKTLNPPPEIVTLDLSYLSLISAVDICENILSPGGIAICLIKPIFEVDSREIRRTGKINDRTLLMALLSDMLAGFENSGWRIVGFTNSPIRGNRGTLEFFTALTKNASIASIDAAGQNALIEKALTEAQSLVDFEKNRTCV